MWWFYQIQNYSLKKEITLFPRTICVQHTKANKTDNNINEQFGLEVHTLLRDRVNAVCY